MIRQADLTWGLRLPAALSLVVLCLTTALVSPGYGADGSGADGAKPDAPKIRTIQLSMGNYSPPPLGLDPVRPPRNNRQTPEKIALGKQLFFDPRLSVDGSISCASCHDPKLGWSNGLSFAFGVKGQIGTRSAPTILNAAYADTLFWDGRAGSLEEQALGPLTNPVEMGNSPQQVVDTLNGIPGYVAGFERAFGEGGISIRRVTQAIAAYERTLTSGNSLFDRFKYGGEKTLLTASQMRGMKLFRDKEGPNCAKCHRFDDFTADLTDFRFHNVGVGIDHPNPDLGRERVTGRAEDRGKFRTPTLRNIADTAPYMHDGRFATLEQVVDFYAKGAVPNPNLDQEIGEFTLSDQEKADLIAFLHTFSGDRHLESPPQLP